MPLNKSRFAIFAVALPLLAMLFWTFFVGFTHSAGDTWRVKIIGYDPIDLLSGHYLRFRYDLGPQNICQMATQSDIKSSEKFCTCVEPNEEQVLETTKVMACIYAQNDCQRSIQGSCQGGTFVTGSERFYFPENYASVLAVVPPESYAEVKLNTNGYVALQGIFVKSQPILEYSKMQLDAPKP